MQLKLLVVGLLPLITIQILMAAKARAEVGEINVITAEVSAPTSNPI